MEKSLSKAHSPRQDTLGPRFPLPFTLSFLCLPGALFCVFSPSWLSLAVLSIGPRNSSVLFPRPPEYQRNLAPQYPNNPFLPRVWCQVNMPGTAAAAGASCKGTLSSVIAAFVRERKPRLYSQRNWCCVIKQAGSFCFVLR